MCKEQLADVNRNTLCASYGEPVMMVVKASKRFHDRPLADHASKVCIRVGLFASSDILLEGNAWYLGHERFLEAPFGKHGKNMSEIVFMDPVHPAFRRTFQPF
jgi:hypothetical protein